MKEEKARKTWYLTIKGKEEDISLGKSVLGLTVGHLFLSTLPSSKSFVMSPDGNIFLSRGMDARDDKNDQKIARRKLEKKNMLEYFFLLPTPMNF